MSFNTALSGLQSASKELGVIANNVANASTTGFKSSRAEFADVYASSGLGSGGESIGSGILLTSVAQQFSQGQINFTQNSLDLAVNGAGFFVLTDNGSVAYSRAGAFNVDRDGYIANSLSQRLTGFLSNSTGEITGARGDLHISTGNLAPNATSELSLSVNLNSDDIAPLNAFAIGFTPDNPPDPSTYNSSTSTTIYDSLGNSHILTSYFAKAHSVNTWRMYTGVDGTDVTPAASALPGGNQYGSADLAKPYTLVFDSTGSLIPYSSSTMPSVHTLPPATGALIPAGPIDLAASADLPVLALGDLVINGIPIGAADSNDDPFSSTQQSGSAIAAAVAINRTSRQHGVTASAEDATFNLGTRTFIAANVDFDLAAGDLVINGYDVTGTFTTMASLKTALDAVVASTGVTAAVNGASELVLTSVNGRNIEVASAASNAKVNFGIFDIGAAPVLHQVQRGALTLSTVDNEGIHIEGANPDHVGFAFDDRFGIIYASSDQLDIAGYNPGTGATSPQALSIDMNNSSQYGAAFSVQSLSQDGYSTGRLAGIDVGSNGIIYARYSNGQSLGLGQVALANFSNAQGLSPLGQSLWSETFASGPALVGAPDTASLGSIQSGALEDSNVELADELVALIVAQRNFQANAQTIRTSDAVTQTIINLR